MTCELVAACLKSSAGGEAVQERNYNSCGFGTESSLLCVACPRHSPKFVFRTVIYLSSDYSTGAERCLPTWTDRRSWLACYSWACVRLSSYKDRGSVAFSPRAFSLFFPRQPPQFAKASEFHVKEEITSEAGRVKTKFACSGQSVRLTSVLRLWVPHLVAAVSAFCLLLSPYNTLLNPSKYAQILGCLPSTPFPLVLPPTSPHSPNPPLRRCIHASFGPCVQQQLPGHCPGVSLVNIRVHSTS